MGFIQSVFSKDGGWSSKRIFGGLGLMIIFVAYGYAVWKHLDLPSCTEFLAATCASLLGVDAIAGAINKK